MMFKEADLWLIHLDRVKTMHPIFRALSKDNNYEQMLLFTNGGGGLKVANLANN